MTLDGHVSFWTKNIQQMEAQIVEENKSQDEKKGND